MSKMVWIALFFQCVVAALQAQYKEFPKLYSLFEAGKYDKCIKTAEKYSKKEPKEPIPYVYIMKSWLAIADDDGHEDNKSALNKALAAARKTFRKDKEDKLYDKFYEDFDLLQEKAMEKADAMVKDGKCSQAIRIYDIVNELYGDRLSNYKKSLCMLEDPYQAKDGFTLLRNTMLGVYKDYKTGEDVTPIPAGFARLSKEYLGRNYYSNAEDILRKGVEVFPADTAIRNETVRQTQTFYQTAITSDFRKDLMKLRDKLLWADSCYRRYAPVQAMLTTTNYSIITQYIKYEYESPAAALDFIHACGSYDSLQYGPDSMNHFLVGMYNHPDVRRIEGSLDNLTRLLIDYNTQQAAKANKVPARYVFDYLLAADNYQVAAYFIKQSKTLYPKDKKLLADMQLSLENKLVALLAAAPKETATLDMAEKFTAIAPANKKLAELERNLYRDLLKMQADANNYSLFFTTAQKGLARFAADPVMAKLKKEMVIKDYNENFIPNRINTFGEMKVVFYVATCTPGKVDSIANRKFINVLNYLRRQAGVYDSCFLDAELNEMAQHAALMMKARNDLDHNPDKTWKCYTPKGKQGAGSSNLSLGYFGTDALLGQVEDDGEGNFSVGHRRWVLNPYNKVFGHGSTDATMTLYVFGKYFKEPEKNRLPQWDKANFVSWPPKDFAPISLVPERWSFSLDDGDFSSAKVTVTLKGKKVSLTPEKMQQGYGINTVVWRMNNEIKPGDVYTVTISGVGVLGKTGTKDYTYTIEVLDL